MILECTSIHFYSNKDENVFFSWLESLDSVQEVYGKGLSIFIVTSDSIDDNCLRELLAIFYRYKVEVSQLSVFKNQENEDWFYDNKEAYWHEKVFK